MKFLTFVAAATLVAPAFADGHQQPDLSDLISDTLGYVQVRENVVILEGETMGSFICRFDIRNGAFENYKETGELGGEQAEYACIPVEELEN
ncbi:hypothetical protein [uncultured Litoreibacter sp.]|uniref:hypothetical protein n=1 Tax=uncultured Litoreibacter sp. TaxID=1392394 RepID=UPI002603F26C|nr:hypothetical protein [uncultured Litoreibacter sp.]